MNALCKQCSKRLVTPRAREACARVPVTPRCSRCLVEHFRTLKRRKAS